MSSVVLFLEGLTKYQFLQKALATSVIVGLVAGIIGCFIILRGMSLMGDAISHAVLPGVALSYILGVNYFIGATVFGLLASSAITYIQNRSPIKGDTSIGIVFSNFLALGIILISVAHSSTDLNHVLFGNILAVQTSDMIITFGVAILVIAFIFLFYKELLISTFDPVMSQAYGLNTKLFNTALMLLLTLVSVSALQTVGVILVVAMLITPAATAYMLTDKLSSMIKISASIGVVSSIVGLYISYTFNLVSGSAIVLFSGVLFLLALFFAPKKGIIANRKRGKKHAKIDDNLSTD